MFPLAEDNQFLFKCKIPRSAQYGLGTSRSSNALKRGSCSTRSRACVKSRLANHSGTFHSKPVPHNHTKTNTNIFNPGSCPETCSNIFNTGVWNPMSIRKMSPKYVANSIGSNVCCLEVWRRTGSRCQSSKEFKHVISLVCFVCQACVSAKSFGLVSIK